MKQEFVGAAGNRSDSDNGRYVASVQEAVRDYNAFNNFKRDPRYQEILEHVSYEHGKMYLNIIESESPDLLLDIDSYKDNDLIGGATTYEYPNVGQISANTLRYIKVASDIRNLFGSDIGDKIAEIGVGYGGQMLISDKILKFKQYDLFDLPPVLDLTRKYLESHILKSSYNTLTLNQHRGDTDYDLVISNYAFSELPAKLQLVYIQKIISRSSRGYMTMNSGLPNCPYSQGKLSLDQLQNLLPSFRTVSDNHRPDQNYIIVWGQK